ncbi:MAG: hypothetical protein MJ113_07910 [Lachnospiraceae bacterium]|nr:hypothetical protein [Lachnospiraceae bacterium]
MNFIVFWIMLTIAIIIKLSVSVKSTTRQSALKNLFDTERLADKSKDKDISGLNYVVIPFDKFALSNTPKEDTSFQVHTVTAASLEESNPIPLTRKNALEHYRILTYEEELKERFDDLSFKLLSFKDKKCIDLSQYTNTELKFQYGLKNLPKLSEYDKNFQILTKTLYELGLYYDEINEPDKALPFLTYAVEIKSKLKGNYILLSKIYKELNLEISDTNLLEKYNDAMKNSEDSLLDDMLLAINKESFEEK